MWYEGDMTDSSGSRRLDAAPLAPSALGINHSHIARQHEGRRGISATENAQHIRPHWSFSHSAREHQPLQPALSSHSIFSSVHASLSGSTFEGPASTSGTMLPESLNYSLMNPSWKRIQHDGGRSPSMATTSSEDITERTRIFSIVSADGGSATKRERESNPQANPIAVFPPRPPTQQQKDSVAVSTTPRPPMRRSASACSAAGSQGRSSVSGARKWLRQRATVNKPDELMGSHSPEDVIEALSPLSEGTEMVKKFSGEVQPITTRSGGRGNFRQRLWEENNIMQVDLDRAQEIIQMKTKSMRLVESLDSVWEAFVTSQKPEELAGKNQDQQETVKAEMDESSIGVSFLEIVTHKNEEFLQQLKEFVESTPSLARLHGTSQLSERVAALTRKTIRENKHAYRGKQEDALEQVVSEGTEDFRNGMKDAEERIQLAIERIQRVHKWKVSFLRESKEKHKMSQMKIESSKQELDRVLDDLRATHLRISELYDRQSKHTSVFGVMMSIEDLREKIEEAVTAEAALLDEKTKMQGQLTTMTKEVEHAAKSLEEDIDHIAAKGNVLKSKLFTVQRTATGLHANLHEADEEVNQLSGVNDELTSKLQGLVMEVRERERSALRSYTPRPVFSRKEGNGDDVACENEGEEEHGEEDGMRSPDHVPSTNTSTRASMIQPELTTIVHREREGSVDSFVRRQSMILSVAEGSLSGGVSVEEKRVNPLVSSSSIPDFTGGSRRPSLQPHEVSLTPRNTGQKTARIPTKVRAEEMMKNLQNTLTGNKKGIEEVRRLFLVLFPVVQPVLARQVCCLVSCGASSSTAKGPTGSFIPFTTSTQHDDSSQKFVKVVDNEHWLDDHSLSRSLGPVDENETVMSIANEGVHQASRPWNLFTIEAVALEMLKSMHQFATPGGATIGRNHPKDDVSKPPQAADDHTDDHDGRNAPQQHEVLPLTLPPPTKRCARNLFCGAALRSSKWLASREVSYELRTFKLAPEAIAACFYQAYEDSNLFLVPLTGGGEASSTSVESMHKLVELLDQFIDAIERHSCLETETANSAASTLDPKGPSDGVSMIAVALVKVLLGTLPVSFGDQVVNGFLVKHLCVSALAAASNTGGDAASTTPGNVQLSNLQQPISLRAMMSTLSKEYCTGNLFGPLQVSQIRLALLADAAVLQSGGSLPIHSVAASSTVGGMSLAMGNPDSSKQQGSSMVKLSILVGGGVSEELFYGAESTSAHSSLQKSFATRQAAGGNGIGLGGSGGPSQGLASSAVMTGVRNTFLSVVFEHFMQQYSAIQKVLVKSVLELAKMESFMVCRSSGGSTGSGVINRTSCLVVRDQQLRHKFERLKLHNDLLQPELSLFKPPSSAVPAPTTKQLSVRNLVDFLRTNELQRVAQCLGISDQTDSPIKTSDSLLRSPTPVAKTIGFQDSAEKVKRSYSLAASQGGTARKSIVLPSDGTPGTTGRRATKGSRHSVRGSITGTRGSMRKERSASQQSLILDVADLITNSVYCAPLILKD